MQIYSNVSQLESDTKAFLASASSSSGVVSPSKATNYTLTSSALSTLNALTASSASTASPTLTAKQADIQTLGYFALIQQLMNSSNPTSPDTQALLAWARNQLSALGQQGDSAFWGEVSLVNLFSEQNNSVAMNNFMDTTNPSSTFSQLLATVQQFPRPGDASPQDTGSQLFSETILYNLLASSPNAADAGFGKTLFNMSAPGQSVDTATTLANFAALYLNSQTQLTSSQTALLVNSLSNTSADAKTNEFLTQLKAYAPTGTTPLPQETLAQAQAAAGALWNVFVGVSNPYTFQTPFQSEMEVGGLIAALDRLVNHGGSPAAIQMILGKLQALQADSRMSATYQTMAQTAVADLVNPSDPTAFNNWWSVSGPISQIINDLQSASSTALTPPNDDGTWLFSMVSLFTDLSGTSIGQMSQVQDFFNYQNPDLAAPSETLYAAFVAVYLKDNGLAPSDALSLVKAYASVSLNPAQVADVHNPNEANFFQDLDLYIDPQNPHYVAPPFTMSQMQTLTYPAWSYFTNQASQSQ